MDLLRNDRVFFVVRIEMLPSRQWNDDDDDSDIPEHIYMWNALRPGVVGVYSIFID